MNLYIHNTLTNKKERFTPHDVNKVTMYVCGPTVYSEPHIGNARAALIGDLFLEYYLSYTKMLLTLGT